MTHEPPIEIAPDAAEVPIWHRPTANILSLSATLSANASPDDGLGGGGFSNG